MKVKVYLYLIVIYLISINANAQWLPIKALEGDYISAVASNEKIVVAGTLGSGVYISYDNGQNWVNTNSGLPKYATVRCLSLDKGNIFAGIESNGVYLSTDNGITWKKISEGLNIFSYYVISIKDSLIMLGTSAGLYRSENYGEIWNKVTIPSPEPLCIRSIALNGMNVVIGTDEYGAYYSNDNGSSWSHANSGIPENTYFWAIIKFGNKLFAGTYSGIFISENDGKSWIRSNVGLPANVLIPAFAIQDSCLFAGTQKGLYYSCNNGISWDPVSMGSAPIPINSLALYSNNLFVGTNYGLLLSSLNAVPSFTYINNGLPLHANVRSIINKDNVLYVATLGGIYRLSGSKSKWVRDNAYLQCNILFQDSTNIIAGTVGSGIFISQDNGVSWKATNDGLPDDIIITSFTAMGSNLFAASTNGIYRSNNKGSTWTQVTNGLTDTLMSALFTNGKTLYAGTYLSGLFVSKDSGNQWISIVADLPATHIASYVINDHRLIVGTNKGLFSTEDNGIHWISIDSGINNSTVNTLASANDVLFAANRIGLSYSKNGGVSWVLCDTSVHNINSIAAYENNLYIGTEYNGLWYIPLSQILSTPAINTIHRLGNKYSQKELSDCSVLINNSKLKICFSLKHSAFVSINMFSLDGREYVSLGSKYYEAGLINLSLLTNNIKPGFYILKIKAGNAILQKTIPFIL